MKPAVPVLVVLGVLGLLYRLHPLLVGQPALSETFMTEDGYLMLTIARNIAIGLGMTVSDGTIATNGVQPLATFLFAVPYLATGGDKVGSLVGIHLIATAVSLGGLVAMWAFARRMLAPLGAGPVWPGVAALLWFLAPLLLLHTMNGLETGLYTLVLLATLLQFARVLGKGAGAGLGDRLLLGLLGGLVFLARNDAAFLVTAIFAVWALWDLARLRLGLGAMLGRLVPPGLVSLAVAAPWLVNNQIRFGSIVPISGSAQSLSARIGQNLDLIPATLFEYVFPMLPVPNGVERLGWVAPVLAVATALVLGLFLVQFARRAGPVMLAVTGAYLAHGVALVGYYGLYFGAPHFMSRYLSPMAPLLIVAALWVALSLGRRLLPARPELLARAYGFGGLALCLLLLLRLLLPGMKEQGHAQVVRWVDGNVPPAAWVGAVQTGTLGYWHDRTVNLDGKVNPEALEARRRDGHVLGYVTQSRIDYIVDWAGVAGWIDHPEGGFAEAFELVLRDPEANLSVMRRRTLHPPE